MKVEIQNYFGIAANRKVIIHPKHLMKEWKEIAKTHDISHCAIWTKCLKPHVIKMNFQIKNLVNKLPDLKGIHSEPFTE